MKFFDVLNISITVVLFVVVLRLVYIFVVRSKRIILKGKDDYIFLLAVIIVIMFVFPYKNDISALEALRNSLMYIVVIILMLMKRGISSGGVEKLFKIIKWDEIDRIVISTYQISKITAVFYTENKKEYPLIFPLYKKQILKDELGKLNQNEKIVDLTEK